MSQESAYDCVIIGASPGGLQAAVYLCRYNRRVLVIDRGGGRTTMAKHIENYLGQTMISGRELIDRGIAQVRRFGGEVIKGTVTSIAKSGGIFSVDATSGNCSAPFAVAASGGRDVLPKISNLWQFFGSGFFTCVDCDGYATINRKLLVLGNSDAAVRLALAVRDMYTPHVTLLMTGYLPPAPSLEALSDAAIRFESGVPKHIAGQGHIEGLGLDDGRVLACDAILSNYGFEANVAYLQELDPKKDAHGRSFVVNHHNESSVG
ncbi:MAG TPA: NAD(P)/FAD-dependent oxidoreductase, partial [Dissulfurispiraceae bacterium]|nr:NAD(P)/FAD-dependent oxidoreductase [Dissulfurispiraceae bacterium]